MHAVGTSLIQWFFLTGFILFVLYMIVRTFFYRSVAQKEERTSASMKLTLSEAEILIRKHQLQLQRALGNIDIMTQEMNALKNEVKVLKARNSQYRIETDKYKARIKELEQKIEALL
ncbi:MAG: hypothetical protein J1E28_05220 [Helicobacter sp.]|uniref:hypothetical protein n=1 Tax=Helicobacter sp. TaxID=218 RepID=UPI0025C4B7D7|nr:hypothetical protein [Helicobacter sp.]MCH5313772.1 hypothetical protein [Helicobacter sp.]